MPLLNVMIYGLGDAINPCNLSSAILFAALLGWLRQKGMPYAVSVCRISCGVIRQKRTRVMEFIHLELIICILICQERSCFIMLYVKNC